MAPTSTPPAALRVRQIPLSRLHAAPWNANRVPSAMLERVRNSIRRFGIVENLVARPLPNPCPVCGGKDHLEVISGNHRLDIYREEGLKLAPCHAIELDDAHARILAQTLNRTRGSDDPEAYAELLRQVLEEIDVDTVTAFLPETEHSIDRLLGDATAPDADATALPPENPSTKRGEVYQLGPHRLMCGDALNRDDVEQLLDGAQPTLLATDPPYGVSLDLVWLERQTEPEYGRKPPPVAIARNYTASGDHDLRVDWSEAWRLVPSLTVAYVWHASQWCVEVGAGLRRIGFDIAQQIVWDCSRDIGRAKGAIRCAKVRTTVAGT